MKTIYILIIVMFTLTLGHTLQATPSKPIEHHHGQRTHTHPLPIDGLNHKHGNGEIGSSKAFSEDLNDKNETAKTENKHIQQALQSTSVSNKTAEALSIPQKKEKISSLIENPPTELELAVYVLLGVVLLGVILGWTNKTVIFLDYDDMALSFGVFAIPVAMFFIVSYLGITSQNSLLAIIGIPTAITFIAVLVKTWKSGVRFTFPIVIITKLFLGLFYILAIWQLLSPSGKSRNERRNRRASASFFLIIFTPIIVSLVKNREGTLFNASSVKGKGIKGVAQIRKSLE